MLNVIVPAQPSEDRVIPLDKEGADVALVHLEKTRSDLAKHT
jgi:hypothetical protein